MPAVQDPLPEFLPDSGALVTQSLVLGSKKTLLTPTLPTPPPHQRRNQFVNGQLPLGINGWSISQPAIQTSVSEDCGVHGTHIFHLSAYVPYC